MTAKNNPLSPLISEGTSGTQAFEVATMSVTNRLTAGEVRVTDSDTSTSTITGAAVVTGGVGVGENLYVGGLINGASTLTLTGAATLSSTLAVTGATTLTGAATLSSTLSVTGNIAVNTNKFNITAASGNTAIAGTLDVTGTATFAAAVYCGSTLNTVGNTAVGGTLDVTGATTLDGLTATGTSIFYGNVGMGVATDAAFHLNVLDAQQVTSAGNNAYISLKNTGTGGRQYTILSTGNGGGVASDGSFVVRDSTGTANRIIIDSSGNVKIAGTAVRATTAGTNHLDIFNGTAPAGTLTNGVSLYSSSGEFYAMDAAGNATLNSPHDDEGNWIFYSKNTNTGKVLKVHMEKFVKFLDDKFKMNMIEEYMEER